MFKSILLLFNKTNKKFLKLKVFEANKKTHFLLLHKNISYFSIVESKFPYIHCYKKVKLTFEMFIKNPKMMVNG